ncbi:MAG: hypothetical protein ACR2O0_11335, partial [Rhizobiaceae bacterium]
MFAENFTAHQHFPSLFRHVRKCTADFVVGVYLGFINRQQGPAQIETVFMREEDFKMTISKNIRNTAIAGFAAVAMIAAGSVAAPSQAHAGNFGAAVLGGIVAGGLIAATARPVYAAPA